MQAKKDVTILPSLFCFPVPALTFISGTVAYQRTLWSLPDSLTSSPDFWHMPSSSAVWLCLGHSRTQHNCMLRGTVATFKPVLLQSQLLWSSVEITAYQGCPLIFCARSAPSLDLVHVSGILIQLGIAHPISAFASRCCHLAWPSMSPGSIQRVGFCSLAMPLAFVWTSRWK